jgi:hypothetical protein
MGDLYHAGKRMVSNIPFALVDNRLNSGYIIV